MHANEFSANSTSPESFQADCIWRKSNNSEALFDEAYTTAFISFYNLLIITDQLHYNNIRADQIITFELYNILIIQSNAITFYFNFIVEL